MSYLRLPYKPPWPEWLKQQKFVFPQFWRKSETRVPHGWVLVKTLCLSGSKVATISSVLTYIPG